MGAADSLLAKRRMEGSTAIAKDKLTLILRLMRRKSTLSRDPERFCWLKNTGPQQRRVALFNFRRRPLSRQTGANNRSAPVLPDNDVVNRLAEVVAIPDVLFRG